MKISSITSNNRRRVLELVAGRRTFTFPHARLSPMPHAGDPLVEVWPDLELGGEGFSWRLRSGAEGTLHMDAVLEENRDPSFMTDLLLYRLSLEAEEQRSRCGISNRELIRRLGTSASQYYRLLDPANTRKSMADLITLLNVMGCDVDVVVKPRRT